MEDAEMEIRVFQFRTGFKKHKVSCNASQTVYAALNANDAFKSYTNKHKNKEIIIQRVREKVPGAAVKTDFPCRLLENDEILNITFIGNKENISTEPNAVETSPSYKIFYIRTRGKQKKKIMKNNELALNVDYVCVYALKGETLKMALQRDGRFSDEIFSNGCEIMDIFKDASYDLSLPVDCLCEQQFEIYVRFPKPLASDIPQSNEEVNLASSEAPADPPTAELSKQPKIENQTQQKEKKRKTRKTRKGRMTEITWDTENTFQPHPDEFMREQCKNLLEQVKDNPQVFNVEFGKSITNFTEVSLLKKLSEVSDAVCVIVQGDTIYGTGFLLFDKFVLTNAHVVEKFLKPEDSVNRTLAVTLEAGFNYVHIKAEVEWLPFEEELAAYCYKNVDMFTRYDYALLKLKTDQTIYPQLLKCYKDTPPKNGGIYIVGHPNCQTKKVDFCTITETVNQLLAINKHVSENAMCPYVSWQIWPNLRENQITYDSCFFHGASGSPVFDESLFLVGVHTGGFDYKDSNETRSVIEYCISMQSIRKSILETGTPDVIELLRKFKSENIPAPGTNIPVNEELQDKDGVPMETDSS